MNLNHVAAWDVDITRAGKHGNPWVIGRDGTRAEVIAKHKHWLKNAPAYVALIRRELRGKVLGCVCKPLPCHGDILARVANGEEP